MTADDTRANGESNGPPPLPENDCKPLEPVVQEERVVALDVLRGFALMGILISNMLHFSQPLEQMGFRSAWWLGSMDWLADGLSILLIEGKFYPLFSFLFGLGFSIQMERAESRGVDFSSLYRRRLFILMGFGILHGIFLWEGDVLLSYAVCGFLLLLFRKLRPAVLAVWAWIFLLLPSVLILLGGVVFQMLSGHVMFADIMQAASVGDPEIRRELIQVFASGTYADVVSYRLGNIIIASLGMMIFAPGFLGLFLFGLLAGRKKIITQMVGQRRVLLRIVLICGIVGLIGNSCGAWVLMHSSASVNFAAMLTGTGIIGIFGPVLTAAYIAGIVLLIGQSPTFPFLSMIANTGKMALTHYLLQSLVATSIFYGYGLGLAGSVGRLGTICIALLIFATQVVGSAIWLKHFRFGPMEWLWRSLTYRTCQPIVRDSKKNFTSP